MFSPAVPLDPARLFACIGSGPCVYPDFGETFARLDVTNFGGETYLTAAAASVSGSFIGVQGGGVFRRVNGRMDWTEVATGAGDSDLALRGNALYIARNDVSWRPPPTSNLAVLPSWTMRGGGTFETGARAGRDPW